jgi:hypothetical protein
MAVVAAMTSRKKPPIPLTEFARAMDRDGLPRLADWFFAEIVANANAYGLFET